MLFVDFSGFIKIEMIVILIHSEVRDYVYEIFFPKILIIWSNRWTLQRKSEMVEVEEAERELQAENFAFSEVLWPQIKDF